MIIVARQAALTGRTFGMTLRAFHLFQRQKSTCFDVRRISVYRPIGSDELREEKLEILSEAMASYTGTSSGHQRYVRSVREIGKPAHWVAVAKCKPVDSKVAVLI